LWARLSPLLLGYLYWIFGAFNGVLGLLSGGSIDGKLGSLSVANPWVWSYAALISAILTVLYLLMKVIDAFVRGVLRPQSTRDGHNVSYGVKRCVPTSI